ncbi:DUF1656 domain-containing protein [Plasticicumulans acidivorans]|uniref:Uncharacterized protein DUF1656 n=1 Tax=Plasticicumulans acidivorans TaxID=886464 RepID=A0A317MUF3_9GAMM|nr:DUF1656 domain-containing protein [Plasticicumulans acidivorans]PWV61239.1 uncharacterized protein DUF1656 [Plasticicumulans acidivorans]
MLKEINIFGIVFAPFAWHLLLALPPFLLCRWLLARRGWLFKVWHTGLFELALYIIILSLVVYQ